jgi:hypothetical protein
MLWLLETITDYVEDARYEETHRRINDKIKENRLLYELGEITKEQYENSNTQLNQEQKISNLQNRKDLKKKMTPEYSDSESSRETLDRHFSPKNMS